MFREPASSPRGASERTGQRGQQPDPASPMPSPCASRLALEPRDPYGAFIRVVDVDARAAQAAVRLVLAQPSIGSQLVDNLNASSHVRAVLTDLFLLGEVLKI